MKWPLRTRAVAVLFATALFLIATQALFGLGVRIPNQDPVAIGRGNAFAATADNPSALYYNPAGITQLEGHNVQVGVLNYFGVNSEYRSPAGNESDTIYNNEAVPQLHYVFSPHSSIFSFGLGAYAPYGLGVEWPEDTGFRTLGIEARLLYSTINPVVAVNLHPTLSVAMGPTINYSDFRVRRGLLSPIPKAEQFKFNGTDSDVGYTAGILWKPHEMVSIGASYRSETTLNYDGTSKYTGFTDSDDSTATIVYPRNVIFGVSFRPTKRWNIEVNADWTDWNSINTLTFENTPLAPELAFQLNWKSSWFYELGVTHYFDKGYFVSAGYFFSENSTTEKYFTPLVPDTHLHTASLGGGYQGEHWHWAVSGQLIATLDPRKVEGSQPSIINQSADGEYKFLIPTIAISVGYHF